MVFLLALIAFVTHLTLSILNERQDLTTTILRQELDETYLKLAKAKTDLLHSEENIRKYTRIIDQSPTSIVITNLKGSIEFVNPRFTELTGYSYDEAIGENPRILEARKI
jgi:PAS domain-containing protein